VAALLGIGALGGIGVKLWLVRPGAREARDRAAAEHQLVQVGGILQRYWHDHGRFPESLDPLTTEVEPATRAPYLVRAMLENPWKSPIRVAERTDERTVLESSGPGVSLRATVEKDQGIVVEAEGAK